MSEVAAGPFRKRLAARIRERIVADAVLRGADESKVREVVADLEGERPLLDWLLNGGFEKLLALIMELIELG